MDRSPDGRVRRIDIDGLMASVEGVGTEPAVRVAYAATIRADGESAADVPKGRKPPSILSAEAWTDEADEDDDPLAIAFEAAKHAPVVHRAPPARHSRTGLWIAVIGLLVALAIAVLVPGWMTA
ncbi:hypothetical protein [Pararhodobacter zhoushanensis]|uniref:Uncharacterized protein n=1 Tax=Pararhodobacter zhoushanensis TaxID=2479545 RepID=A0ABT3GUJ1_9RHOB|nr:hypothetical protein [Pararhodobacter zhoushanensis]MCW1931195.1 hypothetical protein [Pararhodobacter zhoushanensis]